MSELAVVFVAFEGVQPIDVVGPHEVFASAGDAAASLGRHSGYQVQVASVRGGLGSAESLRRVFHRHLGISPDAYRRRFRTTTRHEGAPA